MCTKWNLMSPYSHEKLTPGRVGLFDRHENSTRASLTVASLHKHYESVNYRRNQNLFRKGWCQATQTLVWTGSKSRDFSVFLWCTGTQTVDQVFMYQYSKDKQDSYRKYKKDILTQKYSGNMPLIAADPTARLGLMPEPVNGTCIQKILRCSI